MGALVDHKARATTETLPTLGAFIGLLSRMDLLVVEELSFPAEAFVTLRAVKWLLTYMDPVVPGKV